LGQLRQRIADTCPEMLEAPSALNASLRAYQLRGLRWLAQMTSLGLGACLADDMGLGKTITVIALHLHRQGDPHTACPTLVVCPASVLGNWQQEIERFAPGEKVHRFHGTGRSSPEAGTGFVLTTYSTMRRDAARIATTRWGLLIADEAQNVKNPMSATARALRTIPAQARVALTGTPVENSLSELWAILDWTTPGLLGTLPAFRARWAAAIESGQDRERAAADLATVIRPFLLRRRKSDPGIAPELPPKTETDHPVPLTLEQVGLYEAVVRETLAQIERSGGMARRGLILKLLTGLKQICNHPAQFLKEKLPKIPNRSGKLDRLDELVDTITAEDGAVLVFTQYVAMAKLIDIHLRARGLATQLLHGGTPVARREEMVARFQASESGSTPIFLLSLKAAGTGLNLARADYVIHYDRWWNPAVEDQATDRAYRIGQHKPVQVHRLITQVTVEDRC
jgi:SNF2 family DNA or RNA helicase